MPVSVVSSALVGVVENFERLGRFFESRDGFLIAGIAVGMIGQREFLVRLFDLLGPGVPRDLKNLVVIAFGSHRYHVRDTRPVHSTCNACRESNRLSVCSTNESYRVS